MEVSLVQGTGPLLHRKILLNGHSKKNSVVAGVATVCAEDDARLSKGRLSDKRIFSLAPRTPHVVRRPRRFLFSSSNEFPESELSAKVKTCLDEPQRSEGSSDSSFDLQAPEKLVKIRTEKPLQVRKTQLRHQRSSGQIRVKSSNVLPPSPYKQALVCPHSFKRKTFRALLERDKSSSSNFSTISTNKKKKSIFSKENRLQGSSSHRPRKFSENFPPTASLVSCFEARHSRGLCKLSSFIVVDDPRLEKSNLRCSLIMNMLASFVQQGRDLRSEHFDVYDPPEYDQLKGGDLESLEFENESSRPHSDEIKMLYRDQVSSDELTDNIGKIASLGDGLKPVHFSFLI